MLRHALTATLCWGLLAGIGQADEKPVGIEGKWERRGKDASGKPFLIVKNHAAGATTLTAYDGEGKVVHQHKSEYRLKETGDIRVSTYFNMEVTAGPNKGTKAAGPFSYAYRIEGDTFYEFTGVLVSDKGPPAIVVWKRGQE